MVTLCLVDQALHWAAQRSASCMATYVAPLGHYLDCMEQEFVLDLRMPSKQSGGSCLKREDISFHNPAFSPHQCPFLDLNAATHVQVAHGDRLGTVCWRPPRDTADAIGLLCNVVCSSGGISALSSSRLNRCPVPDALSFFTGFLTSVK